MKPALAALRQQPLLHFNTYIFLRLQWNNDWLFVKLTTSLRRLKKLKWLQVSSFKYKLIKPMLTNWEATEIPAFKHA